MKQNLPTQAVKGIIYDSKGRILFLQGSSHNLWDLPGGLIKDGDTHEDTLSREVSEETGLSIKISPESSGKWQFTRQFDKKTVIVTNYICKVIDRPFPKLKLSHEHINFKWFHTKEIPKNRIKDISLLQAL